MSASSGRRAHLSSFRLLAPVLFLCFMAYSTDAAAQKPQEWISFDQSPPGTPPTITLLPGSGPDQASFRVEIHGFWQGSKLGPDQNNYTTFDIPGAGFVGQTGAPMLPAIQFPLAVPSTSPDGGSLLNRGVESLNLVDLGPVLVWPQPIPERDDAEGTPEIFQRDDRIYAGQTVWPADDGPAAVAIVPTNSPLPHATSWVYPFHWDPTTGNLRFAQAFVVGFAVDVPIATYPQITPWRARIAEKNFYNWNAVRTHFPVNFKLYTGRFLFIYPQDLRPALLPLIDQKKARGFLVTEMTTESIGNTCTQIRTAIQSWYSSTLSEVFDQYCLLVGDTDVIPMCDSPTTPNAGVVPTEDLDASTVGDDLNEEVYLGRLSVDDAADLENQVRKILGYENTPVFGLNYRRVGLVAHKEGAPGKYEGAQESVRTASYTTPPDFTTLYGSAGATDADVSALIDEGVGIVAYRGHGSTHAWTGWNTGGEYYNTTDINGLANAPRTPLIWSFACTNLDLPASDCVGERWMSEVDDGATLFYGASVASYTSQNHELDRAMFRAVFDYGTTTISHAIETAEAEMAFNVGSDNAWMYGLLGDPDLTVRTSTGNSWIAIANDVVAICDTPPCTFEVLVKDLQGNPVPNVLVSAWKPVVWGKGSTDEVFDNGYTGVDGTVQLAAATTPGQVRFWVRDVDGNEDNGTVNFVTGTGVGGGLDTRFFLRAFPSVTTSSTVFDFGRVADQELAITIYDVKGRKVRSLVAPAGLRQLPWDGRDQGGVPVASGVYLARMVVNNTAYRTRVTMLR